jgi:hypothetical protein
LVRRSSAAAASRTDDRAIDEKQNDRSDNGSQPGTEVEELVDSVTEAERFSDEAANEGGRRSRSRP